MKTRWIHLRNLVGLFGALLLLNSCGGGSSDCPTCGTAQNGPIALVDVMLVPEHNPNGLPGGPFNSFDISWVDPTFRLYSVSDRIGIDVPVFSTINQIAVWAIGGDNSVAEEGYNASICWVDAATGLTIPPITSAQGNYQRFGCKTNGYRLPGFFGPNGHFGGFTGGQCCSARASSLNPLSGPDGLEVSANGQFMFVGDGPAAFKVFDLQPAIASGWTQPPLLTAVIPTGASADFDGPLGVGPCMASAQGRAFSDATCGDLRADEMATTGSVVHFPQDGQDHYLVAIINGDPGLPFVTIVDVTGIVTRSSNPVAAHCLSYADQATITANGGTFPAAAAGTQPPFSPNTQGLPTPSTFAPNSSTCIVGQIYYDGAPQNDITSFLDTGGLNLTAGFSCPDPSLQYYGTPGAPGAAVASGVSGPSSGPYNPAIPCHHGPLLVFNPSAPPSTGGQFCPAGPNVPANPFCVGALSPAGLGALLYYPPTHMFFLTNSNSTSDITVGSVDVIDPLHPVTVGGVTRYVPAIVNSYPIYNCMPTSMNVGPGTDVLIGCQDHDGRSFAPSTVIMNGMTGEVVATLNQVGFIDETWYNPGDNNYYLAARDMPTGPVLGVIDAGSRQWLLNVPTNGNAHSVAADPISNDIYVPLPAGGICKSVAADGCVGVYTSQ